MTIIPIFIDPGIQNFSHDEAEKVKNCCKIPDKKTVFLTFDDGPVDGTFDVVKVLNANNAKATFFVMGNNADKNDSRRELLRQLQANPNFLIGNHSQTHANKEGYSSFYKDDHSDYVLADFVKCDMTLLKILGNGVQKHQHARLPGRNTWRVDDISSDAYAPNNYMIPTYDTKDEADTLRNAGYRVYGWDVEWKGPGDIHDSPDRVFRVIDFHLTPFMGVSNIKRPNKLILLMHDRMFRRQKGLNDNDKGAELNDNVAKLDRLIKMLLAAGYTFDVVSNY